MKTREKILLASLALFNEEGEPNVTTVDVAAEIDISPGNLYYHFKGKSSIIKVLYEEFESELVEILNAPLESINPEDGWLYLYVIFERIYQFRFFYQNQHDILHRVPELQPRFRRLLNRKFKSVVTFLMHFREQGLLKIDDDTIGVVGENVVLLETHWLNYVQMRSADTDDIIMLHRGVFQLISMLSPYTAPEYKEAGEAYRDIYLKKIGQ